MVSSNVLAQEGVLLKGSIKADSLAESSINIVNLTQETGTTNAADGTFEIKVTEEDTLLFSSVQYEILKVKITKEIIRSKFLEVELGLQVTELEEVQISNTGLTGNLEKDMAKVKIFNQKDIGFGFSTYKRPTGVAKVHAAMTSSPLALIVNTLNGNLKTLKRAQKHIDFDFLVDKGIRGVPKEFFIEELSIPEDKLILFVEFCAKDDGYKALLRQKDPMKLMEFFKQQTPLFLESLSPTNTE